ncbi:DUF3558 domain-containing protein [Saccharopolyspora rosea]|uniref:DUF3558 domain-containing protein n=1 Tax=Saccharopolyspora rosea TaxID=524884 RepID=UPI0021D9239C|nr:DUF3558 domain-containing protein [Saccharopolyspora rosea]
MIQTVAMKKIMFKYSATFGAALALVGGLAACGTNGGGAGEAQPPQPQPSAAPKIPDPKDASAVPRCGLLSPEAASSLGLAVPGEERPDPVDPKAPSPCNWKTKDDGGEVALTPIDNRSLQEYHDNRSKYADFKDLSVAGHPAVEANQGDPVQVGSCDIFLATKDGQVLSSQVDLYNNQGKNPCELAQKALEAAVPALPAAK